MPAEDILDMHNIDNMLTKAASYNERVWCHYIPWYLKICLGGFNEVNNGFTWNKWFTQGCHKMAKTGVFKMSNFNMVHKWHALFRVEDESPLLINEKRQLPYFFMANWYMSKAIHKCGQNRVVTLLRQMMHMYIHNTLTPKML